MRKKLLLCIIAIMAMVMAVGCGNGGSGQQSQPGTETQATDQTRAEDGTTVNEENLIGEEKAKELALAKVEGATEEHIWDFDLDRDNGKMEYEGEIRYNGKEYEFEINAETGEFIKWEEEREYD